MTDRSETEWESEDIGSHEAAHNACEAEAIVARQVSTPGSMCAVCLHVMNLAPYREDEVMTVHLPSGRHTYRLRRRHG